MFLFKNNKNNFIEQLTNFLINECGIDRKEAPNRIYFISALEMLTHRLKKKLGNLLLLWKGNTRYNV